MCYYARTDYDCHDWKWGNMMLRCPRQHRIGETCGAKLVHTESVTKGGPLCKTCEEIETKKRRLSKTYDNIQRWQREPDKFSASLEKAKREAAELSEKIAELHSRRPSVSTHLGGSPRAPPPGTNMLPPLSAMTASPSPGYEYVSSQMPSHRRHDQTAAGVPRNGMMTSTPMMNGVSLSQMPSNIQYQSIPASTYARSSMSAVTSPGTAAATRNGMSYSVNRR